jgi:ABC-type Zn uptake system ZnuABC Zn-binding protein ZnuA
MRVAPWSLVVVAALVLGCGGAPDTPTDDDVAAGTEPTDDLDADEDPTDEDEGTDGADVEEPVLRLVATVAPITDLVAEVGGDRVEVTSLVPPGADSHTYEPRPQDVAILSEVDAYVGVGLELNDGALDLAEQHLPAGAPLWRLGESALTDDLLVLDHSHGEDGHTHGDDGGHTHGDDGGHTHGDDDPAGDDLGPNPHVWTSVRNAMAMVTAIEQELTALDADGAEDYRGNARAYLGELDSLDEDIATATATVPDEHRTLVTYHDAWTYFARDYGFEFATAVQPGDYSEPSAAEVRAVIDLIRELEVPAIFGSEVFPSRVLDAIAEETDASYVGTLADDVLPGDPGDPEHRYVELMRRNAVTIVEGLGGDASSLSN